MNEQDIIKRIEEETKDLPIPESISPSNMEKMLNEKMREQDAQREGGAENIHHFKTPMPFKKRLGLAMAACFGVIIIGSGAMTLIKNNTDNYSAPGDSAMTKEAESVYEESAGESYDEESVADDSSYKDDAASDEITAGDSTQISDYDDSEETENVKNNLASSGTISNPGSYEEYYDAMYYSYMDSSKKSIYDKGYGSDITEAAIAEENAEYVESEDYEEAASDDVSFSDNAASTSTASESAASESASASKSAGITSNADSSTATGATRNKEFSSTNTQEKNVDEGDIVKTDGNYIYTANRADYYMTGSDSPSITITKAANGKLGKVATIPLFDDINTEYDKNCYLNEFYIHNNHLVVLYDMSSQIKGNNYALNYVSKTIIDVYDISDKRNVKKVSSQSQSGTFESSRISDGFLYTVSRFDVNNNIYGNYKNGKEKYADYIPAINDETIACKDIYYSRRLEAMNTYVVTTLNLKRPTSFSDAKSISCSGSEMYVSDNAIYLYGTILGEIQRTEILKIDYNKGKMHVGNRTVIAGYLYDSFALSEYNGYLRIVATIPANNFVLYNSDVWTDSKKSGFSFNINEDINAVYVLDKDMNMTGRITGLAPGEQIYSARFFGNIGYFVTYRNTDPLFSVDFSDPKDPKILGQLKIPGFSNYLHFYGNDILLGIGEDRDPYTQELYGLKLSMFDIKNPANVAEEDKYTLRNVYYSSAQYNHKSIMIDPEKNIFGFCYEMEDYTEYDNYAFAYYYSTFTYDKKKGFTETARYKIDYGYMYDLEDVRGIFIDDYFYLVCPNEISSYKLSSNEMIDRVILN